MLSAISFEKCPDLFVGVRHRLGRVPGAKVLNRVPWTVVFIYKVLVQICTEHLAQLFG